jgi:hypothetical protein
MRLHATHAIAQDFISTTRAILRRHSTADVQYYLTQSDSDVCVRAASSRRPAPPRRVLSCLPRRLVVQSILFCAPDLKWSVGFQRLRYDVAAACFRLFPSVILVTIGTLLVVVAVVSQEGARTLGLLLSPLTTRAQSFRSIVVALRLVFTVALTLSWCFGG